MNDFDRFAVEREDATTGLAGDPGESGPDAGHVASLREGWVSYAAAAYPEPGGLGRGRRRGLRRAFYMGAWAMFGSIAEATAREGDGAMAAMLGLRDEIERFVDLVRAGRD